MSDNTVVREVRALDEDEFHREFMIMLGRLIGTHGPAKVAHALGYTSKRQLGNLTNGSLPTLRGFYNLLTLEDTAHDEVDKAYRAKKVAEGSVCASDPLTLSLITLARDVAAAEAPDSPGEHAVTDSELRKMDEGLIRKVHRVTGTWLTRLEEIRRPRMVAAK